jgi:hypothetical protein
LPKDPQSPEFWQAVRQAQGIAGPVPTDTINALCDAYETSWPTLRRKLSDGTKEQYKRSLGVVRDAWGDLRADALRPSHVQAPWRGSQQHQARQTTFWTGCAQCADGQTARASY